MKQQKLKLPHSTIVKAPMLLPMLYKVSELAFELEVPERTLRDWLAGGAPHSRDSRRHIWINGREFSRWVLTFKPTRRSCRLSKSQAYCLRCKKVVEIKNNKNIPIIGKLIHYRGTCPNCGITINRGDRIG